MVGMLAAIGESLADCCGIIPKQLDQTGGGGVRS